jgi:hypothetical protein
MYGIVVRITYASVYAFITNWSCRPAPKTHNITNDNQQDLESQPKATPSLSAEIMNLAWYIPYLRVRACLPAGRRQSKE